MAHVDHGILAAVQSFITRLKENGITVQSAYLYGSYAMNRANRWSDIDVAIISPDFTADRFEERVRLMRYSTDIDSRIEPVPFHSDDFNDTDPLADEIKKTGICLPS